MRVPSAVCLVLGALACSSAGGPSTGSGTPVYWTPGRYLLEATVGSTLSAQELSADLTIADDGAMALSSSSGLCVAPTPSELERDRARGQRTFECGDATYTVRPTPGGVRGSVRASILEEYQEQVQCPGGPRPTPCYTMRTRRVTRNADLNVQAN